MFQGIQFSQLSQLKFNGTFLKLKCILNGKAMHVSVEVKIKVINAITRVKALLENL